MNNSDIPKPFLARGPVLAVIAAALWIVVPTGIFFARKVTPGAVEQAQNWIGTASWVGYLLVVVAALAFALFVIARIVRSELKWRDRKISYLRSETADQRAAIGALCSAIAQNSYGTGLTLEYHVRSIRRLARTLAEDGADILERCPEIAWNLRAVDDYLVGIAVASTPRPREEVVRSLDRGGPYQDTYKLLAGHIERADI